MLIADDVGMVELLHDVDLLVDILLEERLLLDVHLADDLDRIHEVCCFLVKRELL